MDKETSEIAKLTARISKDPKSKLFVPLAEEYKKAGDIEMAIHVLLEGLKSNPDYVTARSSLGKLLLSKGDLAGAQKEFEDVVIAIPDNFMARKKLGDIFVLQDRPQDAFPHYKIALSQNPNDEELASLMSDIEAGRDAKSRIQGLKAKTTDEQTVKQEPKASQAAVEHAPISVPPLLSQAEKPPMETKPAPPSMTVAPLMETKPAPASSMAKTEEPEEVLVVEPLEPEIVAQEAPAAVIAPFGEHDFGASPSVVEDKGHDFDYSEGKRLFEEPTVNQAIRTDEIVEAGFDETAQEEIPEPPTEDISGKTDDFTTDTLAELYISQGFYEKAIEIYERMLVDKPTSRGLKEKLSWVRAEVARTATPVSEPKIDTDIFEEPEAREYAPVAEAGEGVKEPLEEPWPLQKTHTASVKPEDVTDAREYVPAVEPEEMLMETEVLEEPGEIGAGEKSSAETLAAPSDEHKPASAPKEQTTAGEKAGFDVMVASPVEAPAGPKKDFEPREYIPPDRERELLKSTSNNEGATRVYRTPGRKETIARLETWLTTIKKEK